MNIWSSPFIFFHRKRIKTPALSQQIHCYCCSALRNAYNKISLFRVSDSCLQWSDFICFQYRFAWKYLVWDWLGVAIICSWKLLLFFMVVLCMLFHVLRDCHFWGREGSSSPVLCIPSCQSPWMHPKRLPGALLRLRSPIVCVTKGPGISQSMPCPCRVSGEHWPAGHDHSATCLLRYWGLSVRATTKWQDIHNILKGVVVAQQNM